MQNIYKNIINEKNYHYDNNQLALFNILGRFHNSITKKKFTSKIKSIFIKKTQSSGLYVYGKVGRGKTFIIDLFYKELPFKQKKKEHFHDFLHYFHQQIKASKNSENDTISKIVYNFQKQYKVLFLDEFYISNIADAMLLSRIITSLIKAGVYIFLTSNFAPHNLYPKGLKREYIFPFIDFLQNNLVIFNLDGKKDYRLGKLSKQKKYICPSEKKQYFLASIIQELTHGQVNLAEFSSKNIQCSENRIFTIKKYFSKIAYFEFSEVCDNYVGTIDYVAIARATNVVIINHIPQLDKNSEEQTLRMINFIDCLYNERIIVFFFSAVKLNELYLGNKFKNEFLRASSRIFEMQSEDYFQESKLMTEKNDKNT